MDTDITAQISDLSKYSDQVISLAIEYAPKLLLAIVTLVVGWTIIGIIAKSLDKVFKRKELDPSLQGFIVSLVGTMLKALLVISVASMIGIEMTSFIALLGAAGVAVGMALSGTLQNFAGGVIILAFRPYKVGDFIETQGFSGTVNSIQIFNTILLTPDNKTVIVPNAPISSGSLINFSAQPKRRIDFEFGIGYEDDIAQAKSILSKVALEDSRIHTDPEPFIAVKELAESSVNILLRVWIDSADYWGVYHDTLEKVKVTFDQEGISIPYPQRDVHHYSSGVPLRQVAGM